VNEKQEKGRGVLDAIFPREYDFESMLAMQAEKTEVGVRMFVQWLKERPDTDPQELVQFEEDVDKFRHAMEDKLVTAFSTPFDRQDIYILSRQIDYILNFSVETAREMHALGISPDPAILEMAGALLRGTRCITRGVQILSTEPPAVERTIKGARAAVRTVDERYIQAMAELFQGSDPMGALKKREVYHHLRDAGRALRDTVDLLHRTAVGIG
jgi:hypothetical protein